METTESSARVNPMPHYWSIDTGNPGRDYRAALYALRHDATSETLAFHAKRVKMYRMVLLSWIGLDGSPLRRWRYIHLIGFRHPITQINELSAAWDIVDN